MEPSVLIVWFSTLAVAISGAINSLTGRQVIALAVNSVAATLTLAIIVWLEPRLSAQLVQTGGFAASVFLAPIVMWAILVGSAGISLTRNHWHEAAT